MLPRKYLDLRMKNILKTERRSDMFVGYEHTKLT